MTRQQKITAIKMLLSASRPFDAFEDIALIVDCEVTDVRNLYKQIRHVKDGTENPEDVSDELSELAQSILENVVRTNKIKSTRAARNTYSKEFKEAAVKMVVAGDAPQVVADRLDIKLSTLYNWIRQFNGVIKNNFV